MAGSSVDCGCTGKEKGQHLKNCVQQAAVPAISPIEAYPLDPEGTSGAAVVQEKTKSKWTQALLARDELDGWPGLRPQGL